MAALAFPWDTVIATGTGMVTGPTTKDTMVVAAMPITGDRYIGEAITAIAMAPATAGTAMAGTDASA